MTEKILSILNPVHLPTVSEFGKIADIICHNQTGGYEEIIEAGNIRNRKTLLLQSRFEELTRGKWVEEKDRFEHTDIVGTKKKFQPALLKKEMFVCEIQEPEVENLGDRHEPFFDIDKSKNDAYKAAQSQLWFEGFDTEDEFTVSTHGAEIGIDFFESRASFYFRSYETYTSIILPTVFDFITELSRYNSTTKTPIEIRWTTNFVKQLLS